MNYTLLTDAGEDENGLWYSFLCPQAYDYVETKFKTIKVPLVSMRKFRLSDFPIPSLPRGCKLPDDVEEARLLAIWDGLGRFSDRLGQLPVDVKLGVSYVYRIGCRDSDSWCRAINQTKWLGVTISLGKTDELRKALGY